MRSLVQIHSGPPLLCDKRSTVSRVSRWSVYYISGQNRPIFFKLSKPRTSKAMAASACHGALAQLGERGLCKPEVRGSIPLRSTINKSNEHLRVFVLFLSLSIFLVITISMACYLDQITHIYLFSVYIRAYSLQVNELTSRQ